ncbi:olfactory receptor 52L1-like [Gadus morhua]|uniref:olfactory receptor 52L1-like n=1 Tax=Gadus morhua TaxID=8049 RepID=UPI0011B52EE5|nr:olfactory receptor 52L1-like [Gadus morhua]
MENYTYNSFTLQVEGLKVTQQSMYPVFLFFLVSYLFIMSANVGMLVIICIERSLHQPMYLLFCNLPVNDILGISIMMPRMLADILVPPSERFISYYECVVQAFTAHMFATAAHTVLMIGLTIRLSRCRTLIRNPYCDNASLFKLSCESVLINNLYGFTFSVVLLSSSIGSMVLTYASIAAVCLTSKSKALNSKALKTCSTHLFVYLIMLLSGILIIILHRFPQYADSRNVIIILYNIIPGSLNPLIYGMQSKEIRSFLSNQFHTGKVIP